MVSAEPAANRDASGRFGPANRANPGGRPKSLVRPLVREYLGKIADTSDPEERRIWAEVLIETMLEILIDRDAKPSDRIKAAEWLTLQADGHLPREVELNDGAGGITIKFAEHKPEPSPIDS